MERIKKYLVLVTVLGVFASVTIALVGYAQSTLERPIIKIGVAGPLKKSSGIAILRGAEMAAKEINDGGGVLGSKIQLIFADTEGTAPKATEAIEKLCYSDKVDTIVGAYTSEEASAFQEQSAKFKINFIFHGTTHMLDKKYKENPEKYKYHWSYTASDLHGADYVVNHQYEIFISALKKQLGVDKINVAVISDMALWTEGIHTKSQDYIKARPDCKLVYVGRTAREANDFTAELTELRAKEVHLIIFTTAFSAGYSLVRQAYDVKIPAMITGTNLLSWSIDDFIKAVGVDAAAYNSSHCFTTLPTTPHTAVLIERYKKAYSGYPLSDVGMTYNGIKAYARAVEIAKSLDHDKVQKSLTKVRLPEKEVWGCKEFWFDDNHRVHVSPTDGMIFFTYQFTPEGGVNILHPPEYRKGDVLVPPWVMKQWKKK
jgi:branched-chain amino acid transport system substrate-binding protein